MTSSPPAAARAAPPPAGRRRKLAGPGPLRRVRTWRRAAEVLQALVVLGLPFLRVNGESALRFDVPTLRLHAFGTAVWMDELFVVLAGTLFLLFAFLLVTVLFGRIWCGWACPQTALVDLTGFVERARRRGGWRLALAWLAVGLAAALVSANLVWYFVAPAEFFRALRAFPEHPVVVGAWLTMALVVFADLVLWRQRFCATTCPYAKLQGALLDRNSLVIAYDGRRDADCIACKACVRVCPVGIDIRDGLQAACTSCGECIDACTPIMMRLKRPTKLVGYYFGQPGTARRLLRPGVVALAVLTAASLALTVAVAADRSPLELTVTAAGDLAPRRAPDGTLVRGVAVALENRGRAALPLHLRLEAAGIVAAVRPDQLTLAPGEHRRIRLVITTPREDGGRAVDAVLVAAGEGPAAVRAARPLTLPAEGGR